MDKLKSALANSAAGNVTDLGDFTQYADAPLLPNPCMCEHTNHFTDSFGPQTKHDYQSVSAGHVSHPYIGHICDDCANTCLADTALLVR
jgi:hypothetical protein